MERGFIRIRISDYQRCHASVLSAFKKQRSIKKLTLHSGIVSVTLGAKSAAELFDFID